MSGTVAICPVCGEVLRGRLKQGLCPRCVLGASLADEPEAGRDPDPVLSSEGHLRFGDYELRRELGRGGMGVVYEAHHLTLNRIVALKMLLPTRLSSASELERFRLEAEAIAALDHPNILPIYEVGDVQGQPYFTMKLAEGGSLAMAERELRETTSRPRGVSSRLAQDASLVAQISRAVHYAHQRGIQHRDLKPGNILLDAAGRPYVGDFGLAKFRDRDSTLTVSSVVMGSPAYMSPEQAAGASKNVTTSSDIYSLGAILYELIAGHPPFSAETVPALLWKIVEEEPLPPTRSRTSKPGGGDETSAFAPDLNSRLKPLSSRFSARDLEIICLKCLRKEPQRRYASAEALADELDRWLAGEPILARPVSTPERFARWCRRRPALAGALAAILLAVVAGVAGITVQWRRAEQHSRQREMERYAADLQVASQALQHHDLGLARRMVAAQIPAAGAEDFRGFEWKLLDHLCEGQNSATLTGHTATVTCVALSPDGRLAASGGMDSSLRLWNVSTGALLTNLVAHEGVVWSVAFTPDSDHVISAGMDGMVRFWTRDGHPAGEPLPGQNAALSADGKRLAVSPSSPFKYFEARPGVKVWDWRARKVIFETNATVRRLALSDDGQWLAGAGEKRDILLWNLETGETRQLPASDVAWALAFSPDHTQLAAAGFGLGAQFWELGSIKPPVKLTGHQYKVWGISFSPDGQRLATCGSDRTLQIREVKAPDQTTVLEGHDDEIWWTAWSSDGQRLITASKDMTLRLWPAQATRDGLELPNLEYKTPLLSPDGTRLLTCDFTQGNRSRMVLRNANTGEVLKIFESRWAATFAANGKEVVLIDDYEGSLEFWSEATKSQVKAVPLAGAKPPMQIQNLVFATDGVGLVAADSKGLHVWRVSDGARLAGPLPLPGPGMPALAISRQAARVAVSAPDPYSIWLYDLRTNRRFTLTNHTEEVKGLAFSPDGRWLASASLDRVVRLWSTLDGRPGAELVRHIESADDVAFSPDGRTLASIGEQQAVKLWHLPTSREVMSLPMPDAGSRIAFSPSGDALVFTTVSNTMRLLRAARAAAP